MGEYVRVITKYKAYKKCEVEINFKEKTEHNCFIVPLDKKITARSSRFYSFSALTPRNVLRGEFMKRNDVTRICYKRACLRRVKRKKVKRFNFSETTFETFH